MTFRCNSCDENNIEVEVVSGKYRCVICGNEAERLISIIPQVNAEQEQVHLDFPSFFSKNQRGADEKAIAKLKRIKADHRTKASLEPQVIVKVSGIDGECLGVPASFGTIANLTEKPIRLVSPPTANTPDLQPKSLKGSVGVCFRGGEVTFASKALACARAGCVGVIIIQTYDVWPFTLTDTSEEIEKNGGLDIPVIAINLANGKRLVNHLEQASKNDLAGDGRIRVSFILKTEEQDFICAICHDELIEEDSTVIQMPCLHYFHEQCLLPWLKDNNSCPNCRFQIPDRNGNVVNNNGDIHPMQDQVMGWFG